MEVVTVGNGQALARVVRAWVDKELPGDRAAADRAVFVAEVASARGASLEEACDEARAFVGSWVRHPSHQRRHVGATLPLAS